MSSVFFEESLVVGLQDSLYVSRPPRPVVVVVVVVGADSVVVVVVVEERRLEEYSVCVLEESERVALRRVWVVEVVEGGVREAVVEPMEEVRVVSSETGPVEAGVVPAGVGAQVYVVAGVAAGAALRGAWVVEVVEGGEKGVAFAVGEAAKAPQKDEAIVVEGSGAAVVVVHVVMGFVAVVAVVSVAMESVVVAVAGVVGLGQASLCIATI